MKLTILQTPKEWEMHTNDNTEKIKCKEDENKN